MAIEADTLEVYHLDDILGLFPGEFEAPFMERLGQDVTFGDAQYTLVKGSLIDRMLHDEWDEGDWATDAMKARVWSEWPRLFNPGVLVAVRG